MNTISPEQRAAEEHAAVQPEKGKTYPPSGYGKNIRVLRAAWKPMVGMLKFRVLKAAPGVVGACEQSVARPHVWAITVLDALDLVNQVMGADHSVDIKPVEE